jgi:hypothetical protein
MSVAIFATEADLCAAFISQLPAGWVAYPESCGFDIVLVRVADGVQIGIEAKLVLNAKVITQILPYPMSFYGSIDRDPDFRAVLVPWGRAAAGMAAICQRLGITVLEMKSKALYLEMKDRSWGREKGKYKPALPDEDRHSWREEWHDWMPDRRLDLPAYVPDVSAGRSAPRQLSEWKIKAIKLEVVLEKQGFVTRADFRFLRIDPSRWCDSYMKWLVPGAEKGKWVAGPKLPDLRSQHPLNYSQIEADYEKWREKKHEDQ